MRESTESIIGVEYHQGHVFGSDYDRLSKIPRHVSTVDAQTVFNGDVIDHVRVMSKPWREKVMEQAREQGAEYEAAITGLAEEAGAELYWKSKRHDATTAEAVPKKFLTQAEKDVLSGEASARNNLEDAFMPTETGRAIK